MSNIDRMVAADLERRVLAKRDELLVPARHYTKWAAEHLRPAAPTPFGVGDRRHTTDLSEGDTKAYRRGVRMSAVNVTRRAIRSLQAGRPEEWTALLERTAE